MSDREKAFVLNGLRNHLRSEAVREGLDPDDADRHLVLAAKKLMIDPAILELVRHEQQEILEELEAMFGNGSIHGD